MEDDSSFTVSVLDMIVRLELFDWRETDSGGFRAGSL
jgi:hypothetical protein